MIKSSWVLFFLAIALFAVPALAYIGPGAGVSVVGSLLNTLIVIVLAVVAILFWPIRLLWRKIKGSRTQKVVAKPRNPGDS